MAVEILAFIFLGGMLAAIAVGLPVAIALGSVGLLGLFYVGGWSTVVIMTGSTAVHELSHFGLLAIPMFLLMSTVITFSGIGRLIVDLVSKWLYFLPGALHSAAIAACALFAAMSSSSVATAAAIGGFILPEMRRRGHNLRLGIGAVAVGGTLGIMIPPSNYFILYGVLTDTSIAKLFLAGIIPGLFVASVMIAFNTILFWLRPNLNVFEETAEMPTWAERWIALRKAWTGLVLIVAVIGGIFMGVVTPTEAGGLGAVVALILGFFVLRTLKLVSLPPILSQAMQTTCMMGFIIFGGLLLARSSTLMNLSGWLFGQITDSGLEPWQVMLAINVLLLFLGMFMDAAAITVLAVPLLFPVIVKLGYDPVWFAVVVGMNMELAIVTPPVGLNLFVLKAVANVSMRDAILGTMPYAALLLCCLIVVILFPQMSLWLPSLIQ